MQFLQIFLVTMFVPLAHQQGLLEGFVKFFFEFIQSSREESSDESKILPEYDFIIVGAGTAGCVLANRLSENPNWNILLLEAGEAENIVMDIPVVANYLQYSRANWDYRTLPNENYCRSLENSQCPWPRGKVMGGSSTINYMIYTRGSPLDYDNWAKLGNKGWSYEEVLPYFKKIENFKIGEFQDEKYHGKNGFLTIDYVPFRTKVSKSIKEANEEMGLEYLDYNGEKMLGFSYIQSNLKDGMRHSSNRAYVDPVKSRKNLVVSKESLVKKLLVDEDLRVVGVEFEKDANVHVVKSRKEVVVSAGAINSPQILMLSGIGPKKHLEEKNIKVLKNLKVGYNLMDHVTLSTLFFTINKPYTAETPHLFQRKALEEFFHKRQGPITLPGGCEILSFHNLDKNDPRPQIELLYVGASVSSDPIAYKMLGLTEEINQNVLKPIKEIPNYLVLPLLLLPKSKGRLYLKDSNHKSKPLLFPNYFSHPQDLNYILQAIKISLNLTQQPTMKKLNAQLNTNPIPACSQLVYLSDEFLECMVRETTSSIYHQSGTCKMGPREDKSAVVDERLRVHGVKGLRVVDASIMPEIVAGHTNGPVFMIAEKAADMIKEDWEFFQ